MSVESEQHRTVALRNYESCALSRHQQLSQRVSPQGKGSMETYWLIGKHGKLPERRVESDREEEIDVMAENPHTDARRKQRKAQKKKERENKEKSTVRRAIDSIKEHLPK